MSPAKISLTDSSSNTFLMVRARVSATDSTLILASSGPSVDVDGVGDHDLLDRRLADALARGAAEDAVRGRDVDLFGAVVVERVDGARDRAGGVDHVVDDDGDLVLRRRR